MKIYIFVPNLDRRPEKWRICRDLLIKLDIPRKQIVRIPAKDGNNWKTIDEGKQDAIEHFDYLPEWLDDNPHDFTTTMFAWNYTWYTCLETISHLNANDYGILLLDDIRLLIPYSHLITYIISLKRHHEIKMINLNLCDAIKHRPVVANTIFQYGLTTELDSANLFSPGGARFYQEFANENHIYHDPFRLQNHLLTLSDIPGIFGLNATYPHPTGFAHWIYHPDMPVTSDREPNRIFRKKPSRTERSNQ